METKVPRDMVKDSQREHITKGKTLRKKLDPYNSSSFEL